MVTPLPTPAQEGGPARRDRAQCLHLDRREPMRAAISVTVGAHDLGEGQAQGRDRSRRPGGDGTHGLPRRRVEAIQQIQRRPGLGLRVPGQLKVPSRGTQMAMAQ